MRIQAALVLCVLALPACTRAPAPHAARRVVVAPPLPARVEPPVVRIWWTAGAREEQPPLAELLQRWNARHPDQPVRAEAAPSGPLPQALHAAQAAGHAPDLVISAAEPLVPVGDAADIQPLGAFATQQRLARFLPQTLPQLTEAGAVYGLPLSVKSLLLFYNKRLVPAPPTTWPQLLGQLRAANGPLLALDLLHAPSLVPLLQGADGQNPRIDTPQAAALLDTLRDLANRKILLLDADPTHVAAEFGAGRLPMAVRGASFAASLPKDLAWGVAVLPEPLQPLLHVDAVFLTRASAQPAAALRVADYLASDEAALVRLQIGHLAPANQQTFAADAAGADPLPNVLRAQAQRSRPMPGSSDWMRLKSALEPMMAQVLAGKAPPAQALATAQRSLDAGRSEAKH